MWNVVWEHIRKKEEGINNEKQFKTIKKKELLFFWGGKKNKTISEKLSAKKLHFGYDKDK
jgi:hypothetical protein